MIAPLRALAFDFGLKSIGVAIGQTITGTAAPLTALKAQGGIPRWEDVQKLMQTWQPDQLVVGMPLHMDGTEQELTHVTQQFANQLATRYALPVELVDERLTTVAAKIELFAAKGYKGLQKSAIDSMSAVLILEDWLKTHEQNNPSST